MTKLTDLLDKLEAAAKARNDARYRYNNAPQNSLFKLCVQTRQDEEAAEKALQEGLAGAARSLESWTDDNTMDELLKDAVVFLLRENLRKRG